MLRVCGPHIALFSLLLTVLSGPARAQAPEMTAQPDGSVRVKAAAYEATIGADGSLHNLRVGGTELLDDKVSFSRGLYVYGAKVVEMGKPRVEAGKVIAEGDAGRAEYTPGADRIELKLDVKEGKHLFTVLSDAVKRMRDVAAGAEKPCPGGLNSADVRFLTDAGPWVQITGATRQWGPWGGDATPRQVCDRDIEAGRSCTLTFVVGGEGKVPAAANVPAAPVSGAVTLTPQADGSVQAKAPAYVATVGADGSLHSLSVGGVEMLDDKVSFSRGLYLHKGNVLEIGRPRVEGKSAISEGEPGRLEYAFFADRIEVTLQPKVSCAFYAVFSAAMKRMKDMAGGAEVACPGALQSADVRFATEAGPWLRVTGGNREWGPWPAGPTGRQVWERMVTAGTTYKATFSVGGQATAADLVSFDVASTDPDHLSAAGTPIPFVAQVTNGSGEVVEAAITAVVKDYETGAQLSQAQAKVSVPARGSVGAVIPIVRDQPGWVDVEFRLEAQVGGSAVKLSRPWSAGFDPDKVTPKPYRQPDFKEFWARTLAELAKRPINAKLTPREDLSNDRVAVYKLQLTGLVDEPFYAWYVAPKSAGKHPALLVVPGYGDHGIGNPRYLAEQGYAAIAIQVRHTDVDLPKYEGKPYMCVGIESPETYVYRDIYCMCVRAVDFLCSRPEVDPNRIGVMGMSQGGGLSIATAALDPRIKLAMPEVAYLCDYPEAVKVAGSPYREIAGYLQANPEKREQVLKTLSYFDGLNLAEEIRCPVVMTVGLRDRTCPPPTVWAAYAQIRTPKQMCVYPPMGHAVSPDYAQLRERWMKAILAP